MVVPSDIGQIPTKISSGFYGFKADQFKTWITVYSIPALHDILPDHHLECWRHFVLACSKSSGVFHLKGIMEFLTDPKKRRQHKACMNYMYGFLH